MTHIAVGNRVASHPQPATGVQQLSYVLAKQLDDFVTDRGATLNVIGAAIGAIEIAKAEMLRQLGTHYHEIKLNEHGSAFDFTDMVDTDDD